jgi:hypothetical protein
VHYHHSSLCNSCQTRSIAAIIARACTAEWSLFLYFFILFNLLLTHFSLFAFALLQVVVCGVQLLAGGCVGHCVVCHGCSLRISISFQKAFEAELPCISYFFKT